MRLRKLIPSHGSRSLAHASALRKFWKSLDAISRAGLISSAPADPFVILARSKDWDVYMDKFRLDGGRVYFLPACLPP